MEREGRRELIETIGLLVVVDSVIVLILEIRQNTGAL
jgi:hypothetical protein